MAQDYTNDKKPPVNLQSPVKGTEDDELLRTLRNEFHQDFHAFARWRDQKKTWEAFYDSDQLSEEEKKVLRLRNQPEVVINLIKPNIDGVIGDYLGRRVMMRAKDRGNNDFETAKHITEALRYIQDQNLFDEQENQVTEDLLVSGVGWYKTGLEFDFNEVELTVQYRDYDDIIPDRRSRLRNMTDGKRLWDTVWVEVEDLKKEFPDQAEFIDQAASMQMETFDYTQYNNKFTSTKGDDYAFADGSQSGIEFETFLDPARRRVRVINGWQREKVRVQFAFHPDLPGGAQEITDLSREEMAALKEHYKGVQIFNRMNWQLNSFVFIINKVLEKKYNVRPQDSKAKFPYVRAIAHVMKDDKTTPYGLVKQYIDAQKEYNKRRSKLLHKTNVNQVVAEEGAVADKDIPKMKREVSKPDGWVVHKPNREFKINTGEANQSDVFMLQLAAGEIKSIGVSSEFIGQGDGEISGRAINFREAYGQKIIRRYYASLRTARKQVFELLLEDMQQFWTSEKLIKITDDPTAGAVILNQRVVDPVTGQVAIVNNLRLGKYDIKIDEDVETPNQRQEVYDNLISLAQVALSAGQAFPLDMVIKASNLPNKGEWLTRIAQEQARQMQMTQLQAQIAAAGQQDGRKRVADVKGG